MSDTNKERDMMWLPSMRDQGVQAPSHNGPRGEWYQHGYTWGWNDCLRRIQEERQSLAAPMPQSAVVTDEQISEWALRMFEMDAIDIEIELRRILALAPGISGWQEISSMNDESVKCKACEGKGFNWVETQVGERASDTQVLKEGCEACCETGHVYLAPHQPQPEGEPVLDECECGYGCPPGCGCRHRGEETQPQPEPTSKENGND